MTKTTRGARFRAEVEAQFEDLDPAQEVLVERAVALLDRLERFEARIAADGDVVTGGNNQLTAHPLLASSRQDALALAKLVDLLMPDRPGKETVSEQAARAARTRWGR